jgi:hypothetical protein
LDQLVFSISVHSGADKNLDDIVGVLQPLGITLSNFAGLGNAFGIMAVQTVQTPPDAPGIYWLFRVPVPVSKYKDTTAQLTALQQSIAGMKTGLTLSFSLRGSQPSAQSQQPAACDWNGLLADARAQAQKVAGAAGFTPGSILAVTTATAPTCNMTVRFALGLTFGQTEPRTITINAFRSANPQPDVVLFYLNVVAGPALTPDDITSLLAGVGITGATLTGGYTNALNGPPGAMQQVVQWSFTLSVPFSTIRQAVSALNAAQQSLAGKSSVVSFDYSTSGTQVSPQADQAATCSQADLWTDAKAQAQKVAAAAGASLGGVVSMAGGDLPGVTYSSVIPVARVFLAGDFSLISTVPSPSTTCSMAVQFQMLP